MVAKLDPDNTDALLKLATFNMLGKKFEDSRSLVDAVLGDEPDNIDALYLKSGLADIGKDFQEAIKTFEKIIAIDAKQTRAYIGLARILMRQGKPDTAEAYLKQAVSIDPMDAKPRLALIRLHTGMNDFVRAGQEIQKAIASDPQSAKLYMVQGDFYLRQKKMDASEAAFTKAMALEPENIKTYLAAARFYGAAGQNDQAKAMFAKALALKPDDVTALIAAARYAFKLNEIDAAESYNAKILAGRPDFFPARMLKGEILAAKRNWVEALAVFDQIIAQEPKAALARYYKGLAHYSRGEIRVARMELIKAVELNPRDYRAKILLADISLRLRDADTAEKLSREVVEKLPDQYQANSLLGRTYLTRGQLAEARKSFERLIELQPDNPQGYFQMGVTLRMQKDEMGALAAFEKALAANPKRMDVLSQVVSIRVGQKKFAAALARCEQQMVRLQDSKRHAAIVSNLKGLIYKSQKMDAKAEAEFKAAIDAFENYLRPYFELANLYLRRNEIDPAIAQYKAALARDSQQVQPHMLLGVLYDRQHRFDLAEQHYREALKIDPAFAPAANNLAYLLAEHDGNLNEALDFARMAKEKLPNDPGVMDTVGWVYYKKGLYESAIAEFNDCIEKMRDNATVHFHLGMALYKAQEGVKAKAELEKVLTLDPKFEKAGQVKEVLAGL
jgi:tetratricopeptide (TPR) repeat protein